MIYAARPLHKATVSKGFVQQTRRICRTTSVRVQAFKVTLKTPSGTSEVECGASEYILDAAEVTDLLTCNIMLRDQMWRIMRIRRHTVVVV